ncbi:MAG: N-formylglutamate amidohydrolase [Asticcacaulis sp.]
MPTSPPPDNLTPPPEDIPACEVRQVSTHGGVNGLVFAVPHSGRVLPADFLEMARYDETTLRATEDAFVDDLIRFDTLSMPCIRARYGRAYVDVNRHPLELDPRLIRDGLPKGSLSHSLRVKAGYGVIPRSLSGGRDIHQHPIPYTEALKRLQKVHAPYHRALRQLIADTRSVRGHARLIDWHSMPASSVSNSGADIVLGDLFGESCRPNLTQFVKKHLQASGLKVAVNQPFAGGYTLEHHAEPGKGVEALQIEINRALYMDEASLTPHEGFTRLQAILHKLIDDLMMAEL